MPDALVRPNFFIVGAPRCGTTSLFSYLRGHPDVYLPSRKEPHYFAQELHKPKTVTDEREYLALFSGGAGKKRVGEASTNYLYSRQAAANIQAFSPEARIIIMLRNPVEMIYSLHAHRVFTKHEDILDFGTALDAEEDRKRGLRVPPNSNPGEVRIYRDMARYASQVRRYFGVFPREQILVIVFDDFTENPRTVFRGVCRFLDIDPAFEPVFSVRNPNRRSGWPWVSAALRPLLAMGIHRAVLPEALRGALRSRIERVHSPLERRPPLPMALQRRLERDFAQDVADLSELLGRDLTHWCRQANSQQAQIGSVKQSDGAIR